MEARVHEDKSAGGLHKSYCGSDRNCNFHYAYWIPRTLRNLSILPNRRIGMVLILHMWTR